MSEAQQQQLLMEAGIVELQSRAHASNDLLVWTIYDHPRDYPFSFVVRPHSTKLARPLNIAFQHEQLDLVRAALAKIGLVRLERGAGDDPCIVETWV